MMSTIAGGTESSLSSERSVSSVTVTQDILQWRQKHELLEQSIQKYVLSSLPASWSHRLTLYMKERAEILSACRTHVLQTPEDQQDGGEDGQTCGLSSEVSRFEHPDHRTPFTDRI